MENGLGGVMDSALAQTAIHHTKVYTMGDSVSLLRTHNDDWIIQYQYNISECLSKECSFSE